MKTLIGLFFLLAQCGHSYICVDIHFTSFAGAENLLSLQEGMEKIDNFFYPLPTITANDIANQINCPHLSRSQQWLRKSKSILVWLPFNASCAVTQHEVFGHGYRVRDLGSEYAKVTGYKMYVVGGVTDIDFTPQLTSSQMVTIDIAGVEADAVLANKMRLKWLSSGRIEGRQSTLYLFSSLTLLGYTFSVKENPQEASKEGNDISNFLFFLNSTYQDSYLSYTKTRNLSLMGLLDPFLYYAILSQWIYDAYCVPIWIPMLRLGPVQYLPSARLALTPFGLQGYLENFFLINSVPTYLYFKWGQNGPNQYWGVGVESPKVFRWKTGSLGFRMDVWHQPHVLFEPGTLSAQELYDLPAGTAIPPLYPTSVLNAESFGTAFSFMGAQNLGKWPISLFAEAGYKTAGYLPGEALRKSPIARGGFSGQF